LRLPRAEAGIAGGYHQDRLNPSLTFVYDVMSGSGAVLPEVQYRFSARFSASVGASLFFGRQQLVPMPINDVAPGSNRSGKHAYMNSVENGLAGIRDLDEMFMRLRYSF
jgi:hypothetical protein